MEPSDRRDPAPAGPSATPDAAEEFDGLRDLLAPLLAEERAREERRRAEEGAARRPGEERLGEFRILREIGRGGMGVVYEAEQISLGRRVALKVLPAHLTLTERAIRRFQREASIAARLDHPGIVSIHAVGEEDGTHFIGMELVHGTPLDRILERMVGESFERLRGHRLGEIVQAEGSLLVPAEGARRKGSGSGSKGGSGVWGRSYIETVVRLVIQVGEALQYAHDMGVIHRDVKPSNVLVRTDGTAVLTDFGLAREEGLPSMTITGEFAGSAHYVSPEQAMAKREVDHRADVFSLGATLYELLTLRKAFDGGSVQEVLSKICGKEPVDPQRINPLLASDLVTIVLKALEKEPERRYATMAELVEDLRAFLEYRPIRARRTHVTVRAWQWLRRDPVRATAILLIAGVVPALAVLSVKLRGKEAEVLAQEAQLVAPRVERLLEEGYFQLANERRYDAVATFEEALAMTPDNVEAVAGLVLALRGAGEAGVALRRLEEWTATNSTPSSAVERLRATLLDDLGDAAGAARIRAGLGEPVGSSALFLAGITESLPPHERGGPDHDRAARYLSGAIIASPGPRAHYYFELAKAALAAESSALADIAAKGLREHWPQSAHAAFYRGLALMLDRPEEAEAAFGQAIDLGLDTSNAHWNLGFLLYQRGRYQESAEALRRAIELQDQSVLANYLLGFVLEQLGRHDEARAQYERGLALDEKATGDRRAKLDRDPDVQLMRLALGRFHSYFDEYELAEDAYERALKLNPRLTRAVAELGEVRWELGRHDEAIALLRQATQLDPGFLDAHRRLGICLQELGRVEEAVDAYLAAAELGSAEPAEKLELIRRIATELAREGRLEEALRSHRYGLHLASDEPSAYRDLAAMLARLDREDEQVGVLEDWTERLPDDPEGWHARARLLVDRHDASDGGLEEGIAMARRGVELSGEADAARLETLGRLLQEAGRTSEASLAFDAALSSLDAAGLRGQGDWRRVSKLLREVHPPAAGRE